MKKILVTTDFSNHSKAGMRFAIQLATQKDVELIFFYCFQALIPTTIHRERVEDSMRQQAQEHLHQLEKFVASLYKSMKVAPGAHRCVVMEHLSPGQAMLDYTRDHAVQYICISTRGAGSVRKIIGTHAGGVILKSVVPVLVIPHTYRTKPVKKILYTSDLENLDEEMPLVAGFAKSMGIKADLAHFYYPTEVKLDPKTLAEMWRKKYDRLDKVYLEPFHLDEGFAGQLDHLIRRIKPGLVVFFTHTNMSWFDKVFSLSRSEAFSFVTTVPMLVYRKK